MKRILGSPLIFVMDVCLDYFSSLRLLAVIQIITTSKGLQGTALSLSKVSLSQRCDFEQKKQYRIDDQFCICSFMFLENMYVLLLHLNCPIQFYF